MFDGKLFNETLTPDQQCANLCQPSAHRLGHADVVRLQPDFLRSQETSRAVEAGLNFVSNDWNVGFALNLLEPCNKFCRQRPYSAFTQNRFDENGGYLFHAGFSIAPVSSVVHVEKTNFWTKLRVR